MIESYVSLNSVEKVRKFSSIAKSCPFNVYLVSGSHRINAASLLGIFSLNLMKPIKMEADSNDFTSVRRKLGDFLIGQLITTNHKS